MINQKIRYLPIIKFITENKPISVCEIGSGSYGIGKFFDINFTGVDINFQDYSGVQIEDETNNKMKQIIGNAEKIPLENSSMDLVFSLDTFEHINEREREQSIKEMMRISKEHIIVGFPCGKYAKKADERIKSFYLFFNKKVPLWLIEHLENEYPKEYFFDEFLKKNNYFYHTIKNENSFFHFLLIITENLPIFKKLLIHISKSENKLLLKVFPLLNFGKCYRKIYFIKKYE